jgi:putative two-component system response regulator
VGALQYQLAVEPSQSPEQNLVLLEPELRLSQERRPCVLVVDSVEINRRVLRGMLKRSGFRILEAERPSRALRMLESEVIDTVVVDLMMPEMGGPEFCRRLRSSQSTRLLPILMISSVQGAEGEIAGINSGADEFLTRPLNPDVLRARLRAMLRSKAAVDSLEQAETILFALARTVESRDKYTGDHCERLAKYSMMLGAAMGLSQDELLALYRGGFLHDVGKIAIPDSILFKHARLDAAEWAIMRDHTVKGEEICRPMKTLSAVLPIIRNHHERFDGSGYPDGLRGEKIPLLARVLQVADIYDALTTSRPYKPAFPPEEAFHIMNEEVRKGWRDPELVPLFQECWQKTELWQSLSAGAAGAGDSFEESLLAMRRFLEA